MHQARRLLSMSIVALGMVVSMGLGLASCTPSDAPPTGEPMGGPDRGQQEQLREMDEQPEG